MPGYAGRLQLLKGACREEDGMKTGGSAPRIARYGRLIEMHRLLHGGGRSQVRTPLRRNSLLTGKNTGNLAKKAAEF